ncbi:TonB-dependent receptor [Chitinophaga sp. G-6-1-13]|uniref:TonB-dependent receptor n=1 Tax=Chitinophaga fulva TaxID=2728842 RepID=A0A848GN03_9BACT|nr:TonB-dependent receptor [Chitinophaga fulva]NML39826.1 TonB-dependent receptor [Chitinophaga fulva]
MNIIYLYNKYLRSILCILLLLPVAGAAWAQEEAPTRISISIKAGTLDEALQALSRETALHFTYNPATARQVKTPATSFRRATVTHILTQLLQHSGLWFRLNGSQVLIYPQLQKKEDKQSPVVQMAVTPLLFTGMVTDERHKPLEFASIQVIEAGVQLATDEKGRFSVRIPTGIIRLHLNISYVGKQNIRETIDSAVFAAGKTFVMRELSLSLEGVQITATQKGNQSNSSILFDREAIEQSQAFSMADLLNNLPGKEIKVPDLHHVQTLTLRTAADNASAQNNSLGTAIIIDDILQSNNANMQNKNIGMYGKSTISQAGRGSFDVPFSGLDLRDIPVNNIERIEVISGIASARYGDITNGAVIIDRQAGKTPYQFNLGISGYSTQYSLSKGFNLGGKRGALNVSLNYLKSNEDPRNRIQQYARSNVGLMWTDYLARDVKNTLSVTLGFRDDNIKMDPEDNTAKMTYVKNYNLSVSNRTSITLHNKLLNNISLSMGYATGKQESYTQFAMNGNPKGIGDKDTTGIYEGYYIPGIFTAVDHIIGRPATFNANLGFSGTVHTGKLLHRLSAGGNLFVSANNGQGVIVDPLTPRYTNLSYQNQRPYSFDLLPALVNTGYYLQDNVNIRIGAHTLSLNAGLRMDVQNGWGTLQPRINSSYRLNERWELTFGYGVATKSPTMAYRYPAPAYFDIPLLQVYDPSPAKRVYLVYTEKYMQDNSHLKPMKARQFEWGIKYNSPVISSSLFAYYKHNRDGFSTAHEYRLFTLPVYDYKLVDDRITYWPTDSTITRAGLGLSTVANTTSSKDMGIEWFINTTKIKAIQTSFSLVSSFSFSRFSDSRQRVKLANDDASNLYRLWYGIYPPDRYKNWTLTSKLTTTTHIPRLGFFINVAADLFWQKKRVNLANSGELTGYTDLDGRYTPVLKPDVNNPIHQALGPYSIAEAENSEPFYFNIHLQVAKEIRQKIRFSVRAYNVFNILLNDYIEQNNSIRKLTTPVSLSGEISLKF